LEGPCIFRRMVDKREWDCLLSTVDQPHLVQTWAYGEAKQAAEVWRTSRRLVDVGGWRACRFVIERSGHSVAILQLLDKSLAGMPWLSRLNRGPLFVGDHIDEALVRDVYAALRARWCLPRGDLVMAPALLALDKNHQLLTELGFRDRGKPGWRSARIDLRLDEEELRRNLASTWRNRLTKSERSGLTLRISNDARDVEGLIERHVANMRAKGFAGPAGAFVRALYLAAPDEFVVFEARLDDEPVGGMGVYLFGNTVEYYIGWFGPKGRPANVGNYLYWQIVVEMKRRGYLHFDLGGYSEDAKYGHFKQGMRGTEYVLLNEWLAH
jgi:hypothetical protein